MSTIAFDGKTVAADSQRTSGSLITGSCNKVWMVNGNIVAVTGEMTNGILFRDYIRTNDHFMLDKITDDLTALVVKEDGSAELWEGEPKVGIPIRAPFAIGSGREIALGAMLAGADAITAVKLACTVDVYSSEPIDFYPCGITGDTKVSASSTRGTPPPISGAEPLAAQPPQIDLPTKVTSEDVVRASYDAFGDGVEPATASKSVIWSEAEYEKLKMRAIHSDVAEKFGSKTKGVFCEREKAAEEALVTEIIETVRVFCGFENHPSTHELIRREAERIIKAHQKHRHIICEFICDLTNNAVADLPRLVNAEFCLLQRDGQLRVVRFGNRDYVEAIL